MSALEEEHNVYWPLRDTPQDDPTGVEICRRNRQAIADSDEVWVWWDPGSTGSKFDLGIAWALHKPLRLIRQCVSTPHKSFENVMLHWQEHGAEELGVERKHLPECNKSLVLDYTAWPLGKISLLGFKIGICPHCGQKGAIVEEPGIPSEVIHILYGCSSEIEQHEEA